MAAPLAPVAEISNGFVIFVILGCLLVMVAFLLRFRGDIYTTSVRYVQNFRKPKPMICVHNPFVLQLHDIYNLSLSGVSLKISVKVKCLLHSFWGVTIKNSFLSLPWYVLRDVLSSDDSTHFSYISKSAIQHIDICQESIIHLSPLEEISEQSLGKIPRLKYPLMVILIREDELLDSEDGNTVIGMINIIHIKDTLCTMESGFLAQYLKQANGQTCALKQLYMSSDTSSTSTESYDNDHFDMTDSCVVCQALPVTRALLPCRHTCICHKCFSRLDTCPICRSVIQSYFCIRNENYSTSEEEVIEQVPLSLSQRWERFNDRLNEWLGFI